MGACASGGGVSLKGGLCAVVFGCAVGDFFSFKQLNGFLRVGAVYGLVTSFCCFADAYLWLIRKSR